MKKKLPNREIDVLIATNFMGWKYDPKFVHKWTFPVGPLTGRGDLDSMPNYTTNIFDAWKVVEQLSFQGSGFQLESQWCGEFGQNGYSCKFADFNSKGWFDTVYTDEAPKAICLAALKTIGVEVE